MQRNLSANWIFPVSSTPIANGVVSVSADGEILAVYTPEQAEAHDIKHIEKYEGVLVPGFVNAHCHLELSHLFGKIPENTGLPAFVKEIVSLRDAPEQEVLLAMQNADEQMYQEGIVAVGDISNQLVSLAVKAASKLYYHTFVEVFGFDKPSAPIMANALNIREQFEPLKATIVPHAPYSVSSELFAEIVKETRANDVLTIHNQETLAETIFFEEGKGSFADLYERMGMQRASYHGNGENSLKYHLPKFPQNNLILVHNTFTNANDVDFATLRHSFLYWCLCAKANLYIENNLPDVDMLMQKGVRMVLGTDSLASNHKLSILAEMLTLQTEKRISFNELLTWATLNGAKALGISEKFGSFQRGKTPGINLINLADSFLIDEKTKVTPLI